tara:strand:- start:548 stop:1231 length:684 start_codon:yes stop_codon:yes gene_type:complete
MISYILPSRAADVLQVALRSSDARPFDANVELWDDLGGIPFKMRILNDDAGRPLNMIVDSPPGSRALAVHNAGYGPFDFPIIASVFKKKRGAPASRRDPTTIMQGGALRAYSYGSDAQRVQVRLTTGGMPLNARLELTQGPNNKKQVIEVYTEDGHARPFLCAFCVDCASGVLRVVNTAPGVSPMGVTVKSLTNPPTATAAVTNIAGFVDKNDTLARKSASCALLDA